MSFQCTMKVLLVIFIMFAKLMATILANVPMEKDAMELVFIQVFFIVIKVSGHGVVVE